VQRRDKQLEREYVTNLQQQIYFLELELNLVKKATAPRAAGNGLELNPEAPLDGVIAQLRHKYDTMEAHYKRRVKELQESVIRLEAETAAQQQELAAAEAARAVKAAQKQQLASSRGISLFGGADGPAATEEELLDEPDPVRLTELLRQTRLELAEARNAGSDAAAEAARERMRAAADAAAAQTALMGELARAEAAREGTARAATASAQRLARAESELTAARRDTAAAAAELAEARTGETAAALRGRAAALEAEVTAALGAARRAAAIEATARAAQAHAEAALAQALGENEALVARTREAERESARLRGREADMRAAVSRAGELERIAAAAQAEARAAEDGLARAEALMQEQEEAMSQARSSQRAAEAEAESAREAAQDAGARAEAAGADKRTLKNQVDVLDETLGRVRADKAALHREAQALKRENASLNTAVRALTKKLQLYKVLDGLSVADFKTMTSAAAKNLSNLESIFGQISDQDDRINQEGAAVGVTHDMEGGTGSEAAALAATMPSRARVAYPG
jgi:regulator of replication initiation timing